MKQIWIMFATIAIFYGCKDKDEIDNIPPKPPQGIVTISLDNAVEIRWLPSQADDIKGYKVWVNDQYYGQYQLIGTTSETHFTDHGAINGVTYYYAVSAYDFSNNESVLSKDVVYDTPRPEGFGVRLYDYGTDPDSSGYSFNYYTVINYADVRADFFFVISGGVYYLEARPNAEIQDMGYTSTLDDISSAPTVGWSVAGSVEAIEGHTYVVRTAETNYAKIRITGVFLHQLLFDWAYQTAPGNIELKITGLSSPAHKTKERSPINHLN
jgi:hypothetical protein